jgi:hypothetical protein
MRPRPGSLKPPAPDVKFVRNLWIPMRDGVRLVADVYRPRGRPGPLPVILISTPYISYLAPRAPIGAIGSAVSRSSSSSSTPSRRRSRHYRWCSFPRTRSAPRSASSIPPASSPGSCRLPAFIGYLVSLAHGSFDICLTSWWPSPHSPSTRRAGSARDRSGPEHSAEPHENS